ncbi:MAG: hypothetical protein JW936_04945 [Sedimentisphaerales bacterium]|nr:hypothetical protein [Sedimentisphaerales bacterium]
MPEKPTKTIEQIIAEDGRYPLVAVQFVREGLNHTVSQKQMKNDPETARRHVSGAELCFGLRDLACKRWGMLARMVLHKWNITNSRDFGEIVFLLVDNGWMRKEPQDCIEDFDNVFDFTETFDTYFEMGHPSEE